MLFSLSACSVYKSEGRKQFESVAPNKIQASATSFELIGCKNESAIESWFKQEFPNKNYELVESDVDLEIWLTHIGSVVEVRALQKNGSKTQACVYQFTNDIVWELYKNQFIRELENNMMTLE